MNDLRRDVTSSCGCSWSGGYQMAVCPGHRVPSGEFLPFLDLRACGCIYRLSAELVYGLQEECALHRITREALS